MSIRRHFSLIYKIKQSDHAIDCSNTDTFLERLTERSLNARECRCYRIYVAISLNVPIAIAVIMLRLSEYNQCLFFFFYPSHCTVYKNLQYLLYLIQFDTCWARACVIRPFNFYRKCVYQRRRFGRARLSPRVRPWG